jgi:hypothetical protein
MDITLAQAEKLVTDVQVAHRLVVAYYERLLARLDAVAGELGLDFWYWEPIETSRPCRSSTHPGRNWLWDMVPLYASVYIYRRAAGKRPRKGDVAIVFNVYAEHSFEQGQRRKAGLKGNPDPLKLPDGEGVVKVVVYRCASDSSQVWDKVWHDAGSPEHAERGWQDVGYGFEGREFDLRLAELICSPDVLRDKLRVYVEEKLP